MGLGLFPGVLLATLIPATAIAQPIASSSFVGAESPLSENGAWEALTALAPQGTRFQKNNGAYPDRIVGPDNNHAGARTTALIPPDHYSEIVVGHLGNNRNNVGPIVRVQASGASIDSHYLWWASLTNGVNNLYRIDANGTTFTAAVIRPGTSPVADGDALRLIARGPVIYGIKNGVRDFIYNTGLETTRYSTGTAGMLAFPAGPSLTDAMIASWSSGAAPASSGTWASSTFAGTENPLDEGDRWYPLPGIVGSYSYSGFRKAGGLAVGLDGAHSISGVWSIAPPAKQYSEVTLGTVATGGGGPIVRIDRTNAGQTGWLLFLYADNPASSGIYKINPDGFVPVQTFAATIVTGDKWRLTADGNTLTVSRNGATQFTYTTDGSYPAGDVGIHAYTPAFTFSGWEGGDTAGGSSPTITGFTPTSGLLGTSVTISGTNLTGATAVAFNAVSASFTVTSATEIQATVPAGAVAGPLSVTTPGGTASSSSAFTVVSPPTITGFAPTSGLVGTSVTISGTNLTGATSVTFNAEIASFTVTSDTAIQATVPAGTMMGPIGVTTPGGTATSSSAFTVVLPPAITGFTPTSGPVGTSVTISGTSFSGATSVTFNGASASFTVTSDTAIRATVPAGTTTGGIGVTTPGGTASSSSAFTVVPPPAIAGFAPASGPVGTRVTISGTNLTGATSVTFSAVSASFAVTSATEIQATVPAGATTGPLSVITPAGTASSSIAFTVVPPPAITGFAPASGPVGTRVTITGTNLTGATSVTFGAVSASFTVTSAFEIQATVPAGAKSGPLSVTTPGGTATNSSAFTVVSPPTITGFAPTTGPVGTTVTISGTNFTGATSVTFNAVSASFTVTSAAEIQATVPAGATTGPLSVTTPGGSASSSAFTVVPPPAITGFAPASGPVGTSVTISGTNFTGATSVTFNSVSASFTVTSATSIRATVSAGATTGPMSVTTAGGTATSSSAFTVVSPPTITGLSPTSGSVGTSVTISGTNFTGATSVTFNSVTASFTVTSTAEIQATVPAGATTGPLSVTTPLGTATSTSNFTVTVKVTLTAAKASTGSDTVTSSSNPASLNQINCGATCSASYESGTVVTLTATPATGSNFTSWSGCDTVSGATCTVTMNAARSVTATFTLQRFTLTVQKARLLTGNGTVTSSSNPPSANQISCGPNCSWSYKYGTVVTLTAKPDTLSLFNSWSGCDSVSGTTCTVTIRSARSVTASFLP